MKRLIQGLAVVCIVVGVSEAANADIILYEETFEDGVANNITANVGSFTISSGLFGSTYGLASENQSGRSCIFGIDGVKSDDVRIEADFVLRDGAVGNFWVMLNASGVDVLHEPGVTGYVVGVHPTYSDTPDFIFKHNGGTGEFLVLEPHYSIWWETTIWPDLITAISALAATSAMRTVTTLISRSRFWTEL